MDLAQLQKEAYQISKDHGFHETRVITTTEVLAKLALIHSEVSEAVEDARIRKVDDLKTLGFTETGKPIEFPSELADIIIRTLDLAEMLDVDLVHAIEAKMKYNKSRPKMHGKLI